MVSVGSNTSCGGNAVHILNGQIKSASPIRSSHNSSHKINIEAKYLYNNETSIANLNNKNFDINNCRNFEYLHNNNILSPNGARFGTFFHPIIGSNSIPNNRSMSRIAQDYNLNSKLTQHNSFKKTDKENYFLDSASYPLKRAQFLKIETSPIIPIKTITSKTTIKQESNINEDNKIMENLLLLNDNNFINDLMQKGFSIAPCSSTAPISGGLTTGKPIRRIMKTSSNEKLFEAASSQQLFFSFQKPNETTKINKILMTPKPQLRFNYNSNFKKKNGFQSVRNFSTKSKNNINMSIIKDLKTSKRSSSLNTTTKKDFTSTKKAEIKYFSKASTSSHCNELDDTKLKLKKEITDGNASGRLGHTQSWPLRSHEMVWVERQSFLQQAYNLFKMATLMAGGYRNELNIKAELFWLKSKISQHWAMQWIFKLQVKHKILIF